MELIERYVYAVTRHLPKDQREDVANELHATIEDMVAERSKGKRASVNVVESVLEELGKPEVLASEYGHTKRYLIGPKWFDQYLDTLKKLLYIVPVIVATVLVIVNLLVHSLPVIPAVISGVGTGVATAIQVMFWVTLGFAIAERTGANPDLMYGQSAWSPKELPELPQKRQITRVDAIASMVMIVLGGIWIALAPLVSMSWWQVSEPMLNAELWSFWVPLLLGLGVLLVIQEIAKLKVGNWIPVLAASNVVLNIAIAVSIVLLITTQEVVNPAFVEILTTKGAEDLPNALRWAATITVAMTVICCAWSAVESVYRSFQLRNK